MKCFFHIILLWFVFQGCNDAPQSGSESPDNDSLLFIKLMVKPISSNHQELILASGESFHLVNDSLARITYFSFNNDTAVLAFYIAKGYIGQVVSGCLPELGDVIIIESYNEGATGLSASIVNTSIIQVKEYSLGDVVSYNSFLGGINNLKMDSNSTEVIIYDYIKRDVYCMQLFEYRSGEFYPVKVLGCLRSNGSITATEKSCNECVISEEAFVRK